MHTQIHSEHAKQKMSVAHRTAYLSKTLDKHSDYLEQLAAGAKYCNRCNILKTMEDFHKDNSCYAL